MYKFDAILLDFDGTFADTSEGVRNSANAAFVAMGLPPLQPQEFRRYIGPPLQFSFEQYAGLTPAQALQAIELYREAYAAGECLRLRVFDGIEALLHRLRRADIQAGIASAKPTLFLERILQSLHLREFLTTVCGANLQDKDEGKQHIIAEALRQCNVPAARCLMVGDRRYDIEGAKALGLPAVGMLYGFGSQEELQTAGADALFATCADLEAYIFSVDKS